MSVGDLRRYTGPGGPKKMFLTAKAYRALMAKEDVVAGFIAYMYQRGLGFETIRVSVNAMRSSSIAAGVPQLLPASRYTSQLLAGLKKLLPALEKDKQLELPPDTELELLLALESNLETAPEDERRELLIVHAALTYGFAACARVSEYTGDRAFWWWDVVFSPEVYERLWGPGCNVDATPAAVREAIATIPEGQSWLAVNIYRAKQSLAKSIQKKLVATAPLPACPVASMAAYAMAVLRGKKLPGKKSHFFTSADGTPLTAKAMREWLRPAVRQSSMDITDEEIKRIGTHSLRSGGATAAVEGGAVEEEVREMGPWRSNALLAYLRRGAKHKGAACAQRAQHRPSKK